MLGLARRHLELAEKIDAIAAGGIARRAAQYRAEALAEARHINAIEQSTPELFEGDWVP